MIDINWGPVIEKSVLTLVSAFCGILAVCVKQWFTDLNHAFKKIRALEDKIGKGNVNHKLRKRKNLNAAFDRIRLLEKEIFGNFKD
jgi:hypothetical protein